MPLHVLPAAHGLGLSGRTDLQERISFFAELPRGFIITSQTRAASAFQLISAAAVARRSTWIWNDFRTSSECAAAHSTIPTGSIEARPNAATSLPARRKRAWCFLRV